MTTVLRTLALAGAVALAVAACKKQEMPQMPPPQVGVFTVMLPVSAALVGVCVLGETLTGIQTLALGIALASVLLATLPPRKTASPASAQQ